MSGIQLNCRFCSAPLDISEDSKFAVCSFCGKKQPIVDNPFSEPVKEPVKKPTRTPPVNINPVVPEKKTNRIARIFGVGLAILIVLIFVLVKCSGPDKKKPVEKPAPQAQGALKVSEPKAVSVQNTPKPQRTTGVAYSSLSGVFYTDRHSIRVIEQDGGYMYEAWKSPKGLDEGSPDLLVEKGWLSQEGSGQCTADKVTFKKGNLTMTMVGMTDVNRGCYGDVPADAVAGLTIFINGVKKDHYWVYR